MTITLGSGQLIEGFEKALNGMTKGETKTLTLAPEEAYGDRDPNANVTLEKEVFPEDFEFTEGMNVSLTGPGGQPFVATITEIADENVTADFNHPMAGKDLTFEIEVLNIEETTNED
jgi:peptidylprolyl isomerase